MKKQNLWLILVTILVMLLIAGCAGGATPTQAPAEEQPTEEAMPAATEEAMPAATEGSYLERAYAGEFKGTVVTMTGPFTDEDAVKFNNSVADFEEKTGIDIQYEGSKEFEASISIRVDAGDAPDIVDFPQPGLLANFVKQGKVVDVSSFLSKE